MAITPTKCVKNTRGDADPGRVMMLVSAYRPVIVSGCVVFQSHMLTCRTAAPLQLHTSLLLQRTHAHARAYAVLVISLSLKGHFCWLRHMMPAKIRPPSDL